MQFTIDHYESLPSTNQLARQFADEGANEGLVIVANFQTEGRGQQGNKWESPAGKSLLFSVLLRPKIAPNKAPYLTQVVCRSVAKVLDEKYKIASTFKHPNDILIDGKKICGILIETSSSSSTAIEYAVIGVGLNVNTEAPEIFPTGISMKMILKKESDRKELLGYLLDQIEQDLAQFYI